VAINPPIVTTAEAFRTGIGVKIVVQSPTTNTGSVYLNIKRKFGLPFTDPSGTVEQVYSEIPTKGIDLEVVDYLDLASGGANKYLRPGTWYYRATCEITGTGTSAPVDFSVVNTPVRFTRPEWQDYKTILGDALQSGFDFMASVPGKEVMGYYVNIINFPIAVFHDSAFHSVPRLPAVTIHEDSVELVESYLKQRVETDTIGRGEFSEGGMDQRTFTIGGHAADDAQRRTLGRMICDGLDLNMDFLNAVGLHNVRRVRETHVEKSDALIGSQEAVVFSVFITVMCETDRGFSYTHIAAPSTFTNTLTLAYQEFDGNTLSGKAE